MPTDILQTLLSNLWVLFLVIIFFGGSIFVHELGHFLAARRRGAHVERFSIGFGPAIWKWRARDGVEYRVSWFPLGGYVLLPQMADLSTIEGESQTDVSKLPPVSYATKMIVFVAGAAFNILFAFLLACIVWIVGQPTDSVFSSTTIAEISPKLKTVDKREVESPASKAGLRSGDTILAIDGKPVATFGDIREQLALSSGWNKDGERQTILRIRRNGAELDVPVQPILSGDEKVRMIGFAPVEKLIVDTVAPGSPAEKAGIKPGDQILTVANAPMLRWVQFRDTLRAAAGKQVEVSVTQAGTARTATIDVPADFQRLVASGVAPKLEVIYSHPTPFEQIKDCLTRTVRTLSALVNPRSDIGLSHLSGPIGIIDNFVAVSRAGLPFALWFTILVNVNLAIFNLLPIPVLDGGQMLFATIARLRGRPLPVSFIMTAQSVFLVLLFSMVLYVSVFDVRRIVRDVKADRAAEAAAQQQQQQKKKD